MGGCKLRYWNQVQTKAGQADHIPGIYAIAQGSPQGKGSTSNLNAPQALPQKEALKWVDANAGQGKYANLDKTRLAAGGQSCGGLERYLLLTPTLESAETLQLCDLGPSTCQDHWNLQQWGVERSQNRVQGYKAHLLLLGRPKRCRLQTGTWFQGTAKDVSANT